MKGHHGFEVALLTLVVGCGRADSSDVHVEAQQGLLDIGSPSFTRTDPRKTVAHTGVRLLEFTYGGSFRERIATDGQGRYSIELVELIESSISPEEFDLMQRAREGFLFRYRDFLVRDPRLFARNWEATRVGQGLVAGRACHDYRVERVLGSPTTYELSVDVDTGLVLASRELDANGELVSAMVYESIQLDPDLSAVAWHVSSNEETVLDPRANLAEQVSARLLQPRLLPAGYSALEAATVEDGQGERWLKRTYSDGVEPLFFLQKIDGPPRAKTSRIDGRAMDETPATASSVVVFRIGPAIAIQGTVDGFELMAIGKAPQVELLDMIESALP